VTGAVRLSATLIGRKHDLDKRPSGREVTVSLDIPAAIPPMFSPRNTGELTIEIPALRSTGPPLKCPAAGFARLADSSDEWPSLLDSERLGHGPSKATSSLVPPRVV